MHRSKLVLAALAPLPLIVAACGDISSTESKEVIGSAEAPAVVAPPPPVLVGSLANFDALNDTGQPTHGFEIDCDGIAAADVFRIFGGYAGVNYIRYGVGTATDRPGGVTIRWASSYDAGSGSWAQSTPVPPGLTTVPGESCWTFGMGQAYYGAGCEHFGISAYKNASSCTYHWLIEDPQNPGALVAAANAVSLPQPTWQVFPPAQPAQPPIVAAVIAAPPAPQPAVFGDAQWVKVYKTENANELKLEDLVGDNHAVVPEAADQVEVSWTLLQADPGDGGNKRQRGKLVNQGGLGGGSRAVVRRYEHYKFAGTYDAVTHQAICGGDGTCAAPLDGELGDAIGAQNAAANIVAPSVTVSLAGKGKVSSSDGVIACGSSCQGFYAMGATVTFTAQPASGAVFTGWSGACTGAQPTCTLTLNDALTTTATFADQFQLTTVVRNAGTVTGTPAGNDRAINCGSACSAMFTAGTMVTLTATPAAGKQFTGWAGACAGSSPICTLTMSAASKAEATFTK